MLGSVVLHCSYHKFINFKSLYFHNGSSYANLDGTKFQDGRVPKKLQGEPKKGGQKLPILKILLWAGGGSRA